MNKILTVALREYRETVRTKAFLFGAIISPALILGAVLFMGWIEEKTSAGKQVRTVVVADETGLVAAELTRPAPEPDDHPAPVRFQPRRVDPFDADAVRTTARQEIEQGTAFAWLLITRNVLTDNASVELIVKEYPDIDTWRAIRRSVQEAVVHARLVQEGLPPDRVARLSRRPDLDFVVPSAAEGARHDPFTTLMTPFALMFLLWMSVFLVGQGLMTAIVEEKGSRVMEVLLSAVSPLQLMSGKLLGQAAVGLTVLAVYLTVGYVASRHYQMEHLLSGARMGYLVLYFFLAYFFTASVLAAIGAAVNEMREAQSLMGPITFLFVIPLLLWFPINQNPNSILAVVVSFFPPATPFVMLLRLCGSEPVPLVQVVASVVVMVLATLGSLWAAAKIFRVGVLMYGKAPTPREMLRWIRYA